MPGTPSPRLRRAQPYTDQRRGHAQTFLPLLLLLSLLLSSCLGYKEVVLHDVNDIEISKLDNDGMAVRVNALIENPNGYRIKAVDPDVELFLNGKYIGKGMLDSALVLDKRSKRSYSIPLHAEFEGGSLLAMILSGALAGDMQLQAKGTVSGRAGFLRKRFPFELTESLDLNGM